MLWLGKRDSKYICLIGSRTFGEFSGGKGKIPNVALFFLLHSQSCLKVVPCPFLPQLLCFHRDIRLRRVHPVLL